MPRAGCSSRWVTPAVAMLVLASSSGCPASGGTCDTSMDCPEGEICVDTRCRSACNTTGDCGPGETCQRGVCLPGEANGTDAALNDRGASDRGAGDQSTADRVASDVPALDSATGDAPADDASAQDSSTLDSATADGWQPDTATVDSSALDATSTSDGARPDGQLGGDSAMTTADAGTVPDTGVASLDAVVATPDSGGNPDAAIHPPDSGEPDTWVGDPCGNGRIDHLEECDDGDVAGCLGCSSDCRRLTGFSCSGEPSICCSPDGFCCTQPIASFTGAYHGIWSGPAFDVVAVGEGGAVTVRRPGLGWSSLTAPVRGTLRAAWGHPTADGEDFWVVGDLIGSGVDTTPVFHWHGGDWADESYGTADRFNDIWGVGSQFWVVGEASANVATFATHTTSGWTSLLEFAVVYTGVWGATADETWFVGPSGYVGRWYQGKGSSLMPVTSLDLNAVHGSSAANIWAMGQDGVILYYGGTWEVDSDSEMFDTLNGVFTVAGDEAWAVGEGGTLVSKVADEAWVQLNAGTNVGLNDVWVDGQDRVWIAGDDGILLFFVP